jgi:predicted RNase H-like nuclease (RuvC/YqgF family)
MSNGTNFLPLRERLYQGQLMEALRRAEKAEDEIAAMQKTNVELALQNEEKREEIARLKASVDEWETMASDKWIKAGIESLQLQVKEWQERAEANRRDAERWRFAMSRAYYEQRDDCWTMDINPDRANPESFAAAIDAALGNAEGVEDAK